MAVAGNLSVNGDRLWNSLMEMAKIGATAKGGCNRQTLTDLDKQGRELFMSWCEAEGTIVNVDSMGNMFARRPGVDNALDPVLVGSHLDTQPTGGKFDGALGVLGGLEIIRTLNETGIKTKRAIVVVNWTNEEGSRFAPSMLASAVFAGEFTQDYAYSLTDLDGLTYGDELKRIGFLGSEPVGQRPVHAYFELHIEQGPILEDEKMDVGVVTLAQGLRWYEISFSGFESHTGTTPMPRRHNALLGAARVVKLVDDIALSHPPAAVGTVGMLNVAPNSRNIIPGTVTFSVDFRHPDNDVLDDMEQSLRQSCKEIIDDIGLEMTFERIACYDPVAFDEQCVGRVRKAAIRMGYRHRDIISGAGHDACYIARVAPTAMVFCPCVDGISHNEAEDISKEWAKAGTDVLLHAVLDTAEIADG
jgi:N-carbamoyl-L-amino-acid hydrolase